MDIQKFGKNFDGFWATVKDKINFIRSNPISITTDAQGKPMIRFESIPENRCAEVGYDLVVLSHGLCPSDQASHLAEMFDLDLASNNFFKLPVYQRNVPFEESYGQNRGVFIAGTCKGPMNIEECVDDASSVSEQLLEFLAENI